MSDRIKTIADLDEGTVVVGATSKDYSRVKKCVHGNKYYAYINTNDEDVDCLQDDIVTVSDDETHEIECCR